MRDRLFSTRKEPTAPTTLEAIADLIVRSQTSRGGIRRVITLNFDDLLEQMLRKKKIDVQPVYNSSRSTNGKFTILHPHGYLPEHFDPPSAELVFAEEEYHRLSFSSTHWGHIELMSDLRNSTVVFIGLSMSDPNVRRLLDAARTPNDPLAHVLFRKTYDLSNAEKKNAARAITEMVGAQSPGANTDIKTAEQFEHAIDRMLRVPERYDRDLFAAMGVDLVWYKDYSELPALIRHICPVRF